MELAAAIETSGSGVHVSNAHHVRTYGNVRYFRSGRKHQQGLVAIRQDVRMDGNPGVHRSKPLALLPRSTINCLYLQDP
jgi:hypothetical protein